MDDTLGDIGFINCIFSIQVCQIFSEDNTLPLCRNNLRQLYTYSEPGHIVRDCSKPASSLSAPEEAEPSIRTILKTGDSLPILTGFDSEPRVAVVSQA